MQSQSDVEALAVRIVHVRPLNQPGALEHAHAPLVPHLGLRIVAPHLNPHFLSFGHHQWRFNWEEHRKPAVHAGGVLRRFNAVVDVLVKLCCKVARKSMQLCFRLLHRENLAVITSQVLLASLRQHLHFLLVWVGQVSECEYILRLVAAGVCSAVNPDHVRQLERIQLLLHRDSATDALIGVDHDFVPHNLARQGQHVVGVRPRNVDASWVQILFSWN